SVALGPRSGSARKKLFPRYVSPDPRPPSRLPGSPFSSGGAVAAAKASYRPLMLPIAMIAGPAGGGAAGIVRKGERAKATARIVLWRPGPPPEALNDANQALQARHAFVSSVKHRTIDAAGGRARRDCPSFANMHSALHRKRRQRAPRRSNAVQNVRYFGEVTRSMSRTPSYWSRGISESGIVPHSRVTTGW